MAWQALAAQLASSAVDGASTGGATSAAVPVSSRSGDVVNQGLSFGSNQADFEEIAKWGLVALVALGSARLFFNRSK